MDEFPIGVIGFQDLIVECLIGIKPDEKLYMQSLSIDLRITSDFSLCMESDRIQDTIDYTKIAKICHEVAQKRHYHLLEVFAREVIQHVVILDGVKEVWIKIKKPAALKEAACSFVELKIKRT